MRHARVLVVFAAQLCAVSGCYSSHEREAGPEPAGAIEVGTGCFGFESLPRSGGAVVASPHPRGGFGVCAPIRVTGLAPGGALRGEAVDPVTGALLAEPRFDEPHRIETTDGDWSITGGTLLLFVEFTEVTELYGLALLLRATAPSASGALLVDEREVVIAGPEMGVCETWRAAVDAAYAEIRACTDASECGQDIPILCGCTRNPVARLDADVGGFLALFESWPLRPDGTPCEPPDIPGGSPCDCPPADGYRCRDGVCEWNLRRGP